LISERGGSKKKMAYVNGNGKLENPSISQNILLG